RGIVEKVVNWGWPGRAFGWPWGQSQIARRGAERARDVAFDRDVVCDDDADEVFGVGELLKRGAIAGAIGDEADARGARDFRAARGLREVLEDEAAETGLVLGHVEER